MTDEPTPKFPGDAEVAVASDQPGAAEVAVASDQPGATEWTSAGPGSVTVGEVRIVAEVEKDGDG
jgi:hypothetical protein